MTKRSLGRQLRERTGELEMTAIEPARRAGIMPKAAKLADRFVAPRRRWMMKSAG